VARERGAGSSVAPPAADAGSVGRYYVGGQGAAYYEYQRHTGDLGATLNRWKFQGHIRPTDVVVDFGCGGGGLLANLEAAKRIGVEVNARAREAARASGVEAVASTSELPDDFADVVISNHALEHTLSPVEELRQLRRVLKPSGKLVLWLPLEDWRQPHHKLRGIDQNHHLYGWTPLLLTNLLGEAGFTSVHCQVVTSAWPGRFTKYLHKLPGPLWRAACRVFSFLKRRRQLMAVARPQARAPSS
jgi:SAM-dependent methyltransferase